VHGALQALRLEVAEPLLGLQLHVEIELSLLEQLEAHRGVRDDAVHDPVEVRLVAPVLLVPHERDAIARLPLLETEGPGADRRAVHRAVEHVARARQEMRRVDLERRQGAKGEEVGFLVPGDDGEIVAGDGGDVGQVDEVVPQVHRRTAGSRILRTVATTSLPLNGAPSCQVTPRRKWKVKVSWSGEIVQSVASAGLSGYSGWRLESGSAIDSSTLRSSIQSMARLESVSLSRLGGS